MVQYQIATLVKTATNTWVVDLGASSVAGDSDQIVLSSQIFG